MPGRASSCTVLCHAAAATSIHCGMLCWVVVVCGVCVQMATAPEAIEFFMALFCNTTRIVLLMETVPWKLLVQVQYAAEG